MFTCSSTDMYSGSSGPRSTSTVPCVGTAGSDAEAEITTFTLITNTYYMYISLNVAQHTPYWLLNSYENNNQLESDLC